MRWYWWMFRRFRNMPIEIWFAWKLEILSNEELDNINNIFQFCKLQFNEIFDSIAYGVQWSVVDDEYWTGPMQFICICMNWNPAFGNYINNVHVMMMIIYYDLPNSNANKNILNRGERRKLHCKATGWKSNWTAVVVVKWMAFAMMHTVHCTEFADNQIDPNWILWSYR